MTTTTDASATVDRHFTAWNDTEILDADGGLALSGIDVARLDDDGRLLDVRGFFGPAGA